MYKEFFKEYSEKHVHLIDLSVPETLEDLLRKLNKEDKPYSLIDLGCGDVRLLYALYFKGLLRNVSGVVG